MYAAAQISRDDPSAEERHRAAIDAALRQLELRVWVTPAAVVGPAERLASEATEIGYDFAAQRAALLISDVRSRTGELTRALTEQRAIATQAEHANQRAIVARANSYLAATYFRLGLLAESQTAANAAVDWLDDDAMPGWRAEHFMVFALHTSYFRAGVSDFELFENALRLARDEAEPIMVLAVLNNFAWLAYEVPDQRLRARELAAEMQGLIDRNPDDASAEWLDTLAVILTADGEFAKAESLFERALNLSATGEPDTCAALTTHLAELRRRQGRPAEASELLEQARSTALRSGVPEYAAEALRMLAELSAEQGDYHRAYRRLQRFVAEQELSKRREAGQQAAVLQSIQGSRAEREQRRLYKEMAVHDALTGLFNRRHFDEHLPPMLATGPLSVAVVDIDGFKSVNDENSHLIGDAVLRGVSELLANAVSAFGPGGFAARLGGDELVAVISRAGAAGLVSAFEELRRQVADQHFEDTPSSLHVTVSIGISVANPSTDTCESLMARADEALYRAKRGGRNQVILAA